MGLYITRTVIVQSKVSHYGIANSDDLTSCLFLPVIVNSSPLGLYTTICDLMVQFLRLFTVILCTCQGSFFCVTGVFPTSFRYRFICFRDLDASN